MTDTIVGDLVKRLRVGIIWGQSVQDILIDWMKQRKQAADRIEELEAKLSDVEAERDALKGCVFLHMDLSNHHNAAKCPYCNPILQIQLDGNRAFKARAEAAEQRVATLEAALPAVYRLALGDAAERLLAAVTREYKDHRDYRNAIRALPTPTAEELMARIKETGQ